MSSAQQQAALRLSATRMADEVLAEDAVATSSTDGGLSWNLPDHQGSVRTLLSAAGGSTLQSLDYDGYGNVLAGPEVGFSNTGEGAAPAA